MKRLFLLLFLTLPVLSNAQFSKGNIFLGGTLSTLLQSSDAKPSSSNPYTITTNNLGIAPSLGFFLNEKIALGASLNYATSDQKIDYLQTPPYSLKVQTNSIGINPYVRFYHPLTNSIYFGLQGGISFSRGNTKQTQTSGATQTVTETPNYSLAASFRPILIFFPSPKWGVEASIGSLGYTYIRNLPDNGSTSSFGLTAGSFSFGISYYFVKK